MSTLSIVLLIVLGVMLVILGLLYFFGRKAQKKQEEQKAQLDAAAQTVNMMIIDKKRLKLKDAGLPSQVAAQIPWYGRNQKMPIVKAKVGPQIMNFMCDQAIFDDIPLKKEVKASVSGLYINSVRGVRGRIETTPASKKSWRARLKMKTDAATAQYAADKKAREAAKAQKAKKK